MIMENMSFIPWARPDYWGNERRYVNEALDSSWVSGGPFVDRLEHEFKSYLHSGHAIATSNGTTAIHLAYLGVGIGAGDEVVVPGFAFMAAANIALHIGAVPVFADVDPNTWCLTADYVEQRLSARTKAIVPVHTYGNVCPMDEIVDLAERRGIPVIEDAAESFGSRFRGRMAGTIGVIGTYSMHATKTITSGEGGMVVTDNAALHRMMQLYRSHGMGSVRYWHEVAGHNFRLTNLQAALGCAQFEQIDRIVAARKEMFETYRKHLELLPGVMMQRIAPEVDPVPWVVAVRLDPAAFPDGRDAVMQRLTAVGIETRPGFYSASRMTHLYSAAALHHSDAASDWIVALPSFPSLTEEQIEYVCIQLGRLRK
jgi:perosamine synthetase